MTIEKIAKKNTVLIALLMFAFNFSNAHWSTKGPYGGAVSTFAAKGDTVFLASPTGGVYYATTTQYAAWKYINFSGLGSGKINALAVLGNQLFAATADNGIYASAGIDTLMSSLTSQPAVILWHPSSNGLSNTQVLSLAASQNGKLFAGTNGGGVFVSADAGATWSAENSGLTNLTISNILAYGDTVVVGTAGGGVFISLNGGGAWNALNTGLTDPNITSLAFSIATLKAYAGTPSGVFEGSLTTFTWSLANTGLSNTSINSLFISGTNIFAGTDEGVFSSALSGISWSANGSLVDTVNAVFVNDTAVLAGTEKGIFKNIAGNSSWSNVSSGLNALQSYASAAKDSLVVVATEQGVFVCKNYFVSAVYLPANNGLIDSMHINALTIAQGKIYAATANAGVFVSADTGVTWTSANTGLSSSVITKFYIGSTKLFGVTNDNKVFSTALSSITWSDISTGLPGSFTANGIGGTGDTVFVALGTDGLYANTGSGGSWVNMNIGQTATSVTVLDAYVFAGTTSGVYRSWLNNVSWTQENSGLHSTNIEAMTTANGMVVAGYKGGAQASCSNGQTWHDFNVLLYIPNYEHISQFNVLSSRIFVLLSDQGLLSNSFSEFPEASPDSLSMITGAATICDGSMQTYSVVADSEATSYIWMLPSGWTGNSTTNSISAVTDTTGGTISVIASNGCGTSDSSMLAVTVTNCTGINEIATDNLKVFPNPFSDELIVKTENLADDSYITLTDVTGKVVVRKNMPANTIVISTANIASGFYLLNVESNGKIISTKKVFKAE